MKTELSKKSEYYIPKHRRMELAHFCRQYPDWINESIWLRFNPQQSSFDLSGVKSWKEADITSETAVKLERLHRNMDLITKAAYATDPVIGDYIFQAAIRGVSYDKLNAYSKVPCCRNEFYRLYRKFFWILDNPQFLQTV